MPRVIVITDPAERGDTTVLLDEQVNSVHLSTAHSAGQFVERLGWAVSDAENAEHVKALRPAPQHERKTRHERSARRPRIRTRNPVHA
jgi:hypothetical protein